MGATVAYEAKIFNWFGLQMKLSSFVLYLDVASGEQD